MTEEQLTIQISEVFTLLGRSFRYGISPNWMKALAIGTTKVYEDGSILCYFYNDDVLVLASGSIGNGRFKKSILRDMSKLERSHHKMIVSSEVDSIEKFLAKKGFVHDKATQTYQRGV